MLRDVPLFADCTDDELKRVAELVDETELEEGAELTRQGHQGSGLIVILDGTAQVRHEDEVVATVGTGDFVGEISMVTGGRRTASVVATSPVRALVISPHALEQLENEMPSVRAKIQRKAFNRLRGDRAAESP